MKSTNDISIDMGDGKTPSIYASNDPAAGEQHTVPATFDSGYQAFLEIQPEISALDPADVLRPNLDVPRACAIALGALPAIRALRPLVVERLPAHEVERIDKLERYTLAAYCAHLMLTMPRDAVRVQALYEEAGALRADLLAQAQALARRRLVSAEAVAEIRRGPGHLATANDLFALSIVFRQSWSAITGKTAVVAADIERADELGRALLTATGKRMQPSGEPLTGIDADRRARAFTLFLRAYDTARQAATYLRWQEGDADLLVPSLFIKRSRKAETPDDAKPGEGESIQDAPAPIAEAKPPDAATTPAPSTPA